MRRESRLQLRTVDVARESGYSVQQVRDLERLGVIPPALRATNGYRAYTAHHVQALRAYRGLASAAGPVVARRLLAELFAGAALAAQRDEPTTSLAEAAARIGAVHVRLARERDEALRAREALRAIQGEARSDADADEAAGGTMTITELADALGVRTSTLRFWEQEGLAVPERVTTLRARRYGTGAIREARIVAALRGSGYGLPAVRDVVATLRSDAGDGIVEGIDAAERILGRRLDQIAARSVALLRAGADLAAVLEVDPRS
ncbi:DNA-binding transcriptional regulator, MerR family [Promicromonospora umidemergens]|uniref:MerR family transcriptional regulator n=1 Tax=Promicromonospora umidemergens TaxID=629679 RepID=A0ABP8WMJ8_9MICO|nr:MerR family transcriptional regulator [Promicromonospora umidemergens]MCP2285857.1 DNA-binding transcriptional regulator, MerR family [Promicromonospora umidemergens]